MAKKVNVTVELLRLIAVQDAHDYLVRARNKLASARVSPRLLNRVRLAISSCKGALRNADNRAHRYAGEE